jgi:hypothetical protein
VFKNGDCNVVQGNVAKRRRRYLQDIFTTLVDAQWRWTLLVFALNFLLSWLGFAIIWWLIVYSHGDLSPENNPRVAVTLAAATTGSNATLPSSVVSNWHVFIAFGGATFSLITRRLPIKYFMHYMLFSIYL